MWSCELHERQIVRNALDLQHGGKLTDAEQVLLGLAETLERSGAAGALCLAVVLNNLGSLNQDLGRFDAAQRFYLRALRLEERHGGASADTAATLDNLGSVYFDTGQYRKAETLRQKAIDLRIAKLGPEHPAVARLLQNLAAQKYTQGRLREASELYERAFDIWRASGLEKTPDSATAIHGLGLIYARTGNLAKGVEYVQHALNIWAQFFDVSASVARAEGNLAVLSFAQGDAKAADMHWRRAIEMAERSTGPQSAVTREVLYGYMLFLRRTRRQSEARNVQARIDSIARVLDDRLLKSSIIDITDLSDGRR